MLQKLIIDRVWEHSGIPCKVRVFLETLPDAARCCRMLSDAARCCQMLPDVARCCQMLPDAARWCYVLPDAARCCHMLPDAARWCYMLPYAAMCCRIWQHEYNTTNTKRRWHLGHLSRRLNQIAARYYQRSTVAVRRCVLLRYTYIYSFRTVYWKSNHIHSGIFVSVSKAKVLLNTTMP